MGAEGVASEVNDFNTRLAFKHQWIEDDAKLRPEWKEKYAENCYCNPSWIFWNVSAGTKPLFSIISISF